MMSKLFYIPNETTIVYIIINAFSLKNIFFKNVIIFTFIDCMNNQVGEIKCSKLNL